LPRIPELQLVLFAVTQTINQHSLVDLGSVQLLVGQVPESAFFHVPFPFPNGFLFCE